MRKILLWVYALAVLAFFSYFIIETDWTSLKLAEIIANWPLILAALAAALAARIVMALNWFMMLSILNKPGPTRFAPIFSVYAVSWMGRYIPGKVSQYIYRLSVAGHLGLSKKRVVSTSLVEALLQLSVFCALSLLALTGLPQWDLQNSFLAPLVILIAAVLFFMAHPKSLTLAAGKIAQFRRVPAVTAKDIPAGRSNLITVTLFALVAFFNGLTLFLITISFAPGSVSGTQLLLFVGIASLASAGSLLAIFAPSGVGVVEIIFFSALVLLGVPEAAALGTSLLWRVIAILADIAFVAISAAGVRDEPSSQQTPL